MGARTLNREDLPGQSIQPLVLFIYSLLLPLMRPRDRRGAEVVGFRWPAVIEAREFQNYAPEK
jgi:hypothetical protein